MVSREAFSNSTHAFSNSTACITLDISRQTNTVHGPTEAAVTTTGLQGGSLALTESCMDHEHLHGSSRHKADATQLQVPLPSRQRLCCSPRPSSHPLTIHSWAAPLRAPPDDRQPEAATGAACCPAHTTSSDACTCAEKARYAGAALISASKGTACCCLGTNTTHARNTRFATSQQSCQSTSHVATEAEPPTWWR